MTDLASVRSSLDRSKQTLAKITLAASGVEHRHEALLSVVKQIQLVFQTTTGSKIRGAVDRAYSRAAKLNLSIEHILLRCDRLTSKVRKLELDLAAVSPLLVFPPHKKIRQELASLRSSSESIKRRLEPLLSETFEWVAELEKNQVQAHWSYKVYIAIDRLRAGFDDRGLSDLLHLTYGPHTPSEYRRRAVSELLSWAHTSNDQELMAVASAHLEAYRISPERYSLGDRELVLRLEGIRQTENPESSAFFLALLDAHRRSSEDALLAAANLVSHLKFASAPDLGAKLQLEWINAALALRGLEPVYLNPALGTTVFDQLDCELSGQTEVNSQLLVSVIVPAFNSEAWLATAIRGLLGQSWRNIEVIIVDDCSTDSTLAVATELAESDNRVVVLANEKNQGAYASRNNALKIASGQFVTVHDADDWSHPRKIERQVLAFNSNPRMVANMSRSVRIDPDSMHFFAQYGREILRQNSSSLMIRRNPVFTELGYWDEVKFGADTEYHHRINAKFGMGSAPTLNEGLLSFTRFHAESLTGGGKNSTQRGIIGARRDYVRKFSDWHEQMKLVEGGLFLDRGALGRPFPIPTSSSVDKSAEKYDLVVVANLAPSSKWLDNVYREARALNKQGKKVALVHLPSLEKPNAQPSDQVEQLLVKGVVNRLDREHSVRAHKVIFHLDALRERNVLMPQLSCQKAIIVINDMVSSEKVAEAQDLVQQYVGKKPVVAAESLALLRALNKSGFPVQGLWSAN